MLTFNLSAAAVFFIGFGVGVIVGVVGLATAAIIANNRKH